MVDVASIIISLISFVGALLSAGLTGWLTFHSDERKRLSESEKLVRKYRDPLLIAARDLQSRLYHIVDLGLPRQDPTVPGENIYCYTSFLVGQYFSWTYILRRRAQFLCFSTDRDNETLSKKLDKIQDVFSMGSNESGLPFTLWRGSQMAIGEMMTEKDDGELFCMGYLSFTKKWSEDEFRRWFYAVETGITEMGEAGFLKADIKLRKLQHLLLDLINILDGKRVQTGGPGFNRCKPAPGCPCAYCMDEYRKVVSDSGKGQESIA